MRVLVRNFGAQAACMVLLLVGDGARLCHAYLEDARAPEAVSEVPADDASHGVAREEGGEDEALLREGPVEGWVGK